MRPSSQASPKISVACGKPNWVLAPARVATDSPYEAYTAMNASCRLSDDHAMKPASSPARLK